MRGVVDRMLEHPAVYALWQAPFAKQKFAPIERRIAGHAIRRILDVGCGPGTNAARFDGADYVGIGPTFPSKTKAFDQFPGLDFIRAASAETSIPAFALGGIGPTNVAEVVAAGARRVAVSSAICTADDPEQAARLLKAALSH